MPYITKQYKFCAAHRYWNEQWSETENFEVFGDDIYLHGHNYDLDITISGEINEDSGFIVNLHTLNKIVQELVLSEIDHSQIEKDIDYFKNRQPSTENMVVYIWEKLVNSIPSPAKLYSIKLQETPTISTIYFGPK